MNNISIINNDCLVALKTLDDNSVDSVVTDPPYGISFMGKHWDYDVPKVEVWEEVFRVLKPGGHILCACGTRTQHRMTVNIEDAGFEIRDVIAWIYGSGFPKSLNIGKAIDVMTGNERISIGISNNGSGAQPSKLNNHDKGDTGIGYMDGSGKSFELTKGNSEYEGLGTSLKPAMELWTLARKPLSEKTVATNVLKWGTGGINIDGCRVDLNGQKKTSGGCKGTENPVNYNFGKPLVENNNIGRFPANVIHDGSDEVESEFAKVGILKSGKATIGTGTIDCQNNGIYGSGKGGLITSCFADSGSASRFFYCAKASKSERNKGCDEFEDKNKDGHNMLANSFRTDPRSPNGGYENKPASPQKNNHPTVKPISLMRYLCRMITPKKGTILDPYMGSGSTGIGAKIEGFSFIGIERESDYCKIAQARIDSWEEEREEVVIATQQTLKF